MNSDPAERISRWIFGFAFHAFLATAGSIAVGMLIAFAVGALAPGVTRHVGLFPFIVASALLASFATKWCGKCAPWVGILGLIALCLGAHELWHGWSPSWSHQSRADYVLSQLFCIGTGCSDSEGLYALIFGWPSLSLITYSMFSLIALVIRRSNRRI